ncbi:hypothetical protein E1B06_09325 [Brevibacillus laterosporus]|uniref:hypothetical protein n=1 Tax=Brevibacillus laterosporus TaxID=1465 RepID=UPI0003B18E2E|nr:hypothetical protein [Brevibacillus laterosporus]ERM20371.1 hypothetical protein P615_00260 [Brevibacillus laterosporus PE36]MDF9411921.1 hypothetical protein [Brevibacillus laterosporus]
MKKLVGIASVLALLVSATPAIAMEIQSENTAVAVASIISDSRTLEPEEKYETSTFRASSNTLTLTVDQSSDGSTTHIKYTLWDDTGNQVGKVFNVKKNGTASTTWDVKKGKKYTLEMLNRSTHNGIFIEATTDFSIE